VSIGCTVTTIVQVTVSVLLLASTTFVVKVKVPVAVGVPLITPAEAFSERPLGNEPEAMENVRAGVPPFAEGHRVSRALGRLRGATDPALERKRSARKSRYPNSPSNPQP
jgi:hypothetical protein